MPQWIQLPDGSTVNFEGAIALTQQGSTIQVDYGEGRFRTIKYASATLAASALGVLIEQLQSPFNGPITTTAFIPNTGTHTVAQQSVLTGNGFALDLVTPGTLGCTITIGVDTIPGNTIIYVNNQTLLVPFTPTNAGTFDVVYVEKDGVTTHTLTNGFSAA